MVTSKGRRLSKATRVRTASKSSVEQQPPFNFQRIQRTTTVRTSTAVVRPFTFTLHIRLLQDRTLVSLLVVCGGKTKVVICTFFTVYYMLENDHRKPIDLRRKTETLRNT